MLNHQLYHLTSQDKPLFKYLKKEYVEQLFTKSELLIGTLYDFRNQEKHGDARGDESEEKKRFMKK
ncbi:MAG: hypothetical protein AB7F64_07255 [Gammaproteobacteria bacterium]